MNNLSECCVCGYVEEHGNFLLDCGEHYMCDDCLLSGEALDHKCEASAPPADQQAS